MKNGVYLSLILFLGVMGYFVVNDLYHENSIMQAGIIFMIVSIAIYTLTTHFKKKAQLFPAQKIINVVYISLFAIYGIVTGLTIMYAPTMDVSVMRYEGVVFLLASSVLLYGIYVFMKRHTKQIFH